MAPATRAAWTFTSEAPASGTAPVPLLFIDYDLRLDLENTAPRGLPYTFGVNVSQSQPQGPNVAAAKVWASFDDGVNWQELTVRGGQGLSTVGVKHPARGGSGFVSLRVQAADTAGNTIEQTIIWAYRLR
ncbi:hypothetical protein E1286_25315 [Nonomuraea terrae]|uniref:Uncharacterized protein n=1 Tax=Nonomuraea terrae TaxID=2530383 RepID=A0A4R4YLB9_9ACTN|nr:hypothetical protein [Nonomuraea terrae]TDD44974.1 hypothetical protein E1286_25315 [Nonomuraea terrae]